MTINKILENNNLDGLIVSSVSNIIYLIGDFGFLPKERECLLIITKSKKYIITNTLYSVAINSKIKNYKIIDIGVSSFLRKELSVIIKTNNLKKIGYEDNDLTIREYNSIKTYAKFVPTNFSKLREIKNPDEIKNIKSACNIGDKAFRFILKELKLGITEKDIASKLENFIKDKRADLSFRPIVAYGKNSATPHHLSGNTKLKKNSIVLMDFGVKVNNYCSDMTRTVYFGKADNKFKEIYNTVLFSQKKSIDLIKVGISSKKIDLVARGFIKSKKYPNIPHALGHGIGLDVHETPIISPHSNEKIRNGMVFSIEPGIYLENYGGVRIENLVLIKNNKPLFLTKSSSNLIEV